MTKLHIEAEVDTNHPADGAMKGFIAQQVARVLAVHGTDSYAKVMPAPAPVYVVTTYNPFMQSSDTAGGFTQLRDARAEAMIAFVNVQAADDSTLVAIETWVGANFIEQRTYERANAHEPEATPIYKWKISTGPAWAPYFEKEED